MTGNYIQGEELMLYIQTADGWLPVSCLTSMPFNKTTGRIETTARGSGGYRSYLPTLHDYELSVSGVLTKDPNVVSYNHLYGLQENRIIFEWRMQSPDGYIAKTGTSFITALSLTSDARAYCSFSCSFSPASDGVSNILVWSQDGFNIVSQDDNNLIEI